MNLIPILEEILSLEEDAKIYCTLVGEIGFYIDKKLNQIVLEGSIGEEKNSYMVILTSEGKFSKTNSGECLLKPIKPFKTFEEYRNYLLPEWIPIEGEVVIGISSCFPMCIGKFVVKNCTKMIYSFDGRYYQGGYKLYPISELPKFLKQLEDAKNN